MKEKKLSQKKKGEIAEKVFGCLSPPTEKEIRAIARSIGRSPAEIRKVIGEPPKPVGKLKRAS